METNRPIASLSLDLDNQWSYMKTHGDQGWQTFPSYLDVVVPRILSFLEERDLKITFFIVGQDTALAKNHAAISSLASAGHEIGNHSFYHDPWLHLYTEDQLDTELERAEEYIEGVTGKRPIGFRGPGYSLSSSTIQVLTRRGYLYDATTLPTFLGPLARAYYFIATDLSEEEKWRRKKLFGSFRNGFQPIRPYKWQEDVGLGSDGLIEIPVTTMPILKVPFHASYILYLSTYSYTFAVTYFYLALLLCRLTNTQPSLLLHPLAFLGPDDVGELTFFPAMKMPCEEKLRVVSEILRLYSDQYMILKMNQHARFVEKSLREQAGDEDPDSNILEKEQGIPL
jgi:hypothetical protein